MTAGPRHHEQRHGELGAHTALAELGAGLRAGDPRARDRAAEVLYPVLDRVARNRCRRLAHRGWFCVAGADDAVHAHGAVMVQLSRRLVGDDGGPAPGILEWVTKRPCSLVSFAFGKMPPGEALRAWNAERGLRQRLRPSQWSDALTDGIEATVADATAHHRAAAAVTGLNRRNYYTWLDALWWDACQPAPAKIDADRILRHLEHERRKVKEWNRKHPDKRRESALGAAQPTLRQVQLTAEVVDHHFATQDPKHYETWLVAPRSQTRPPTADRAAAVSRPEADPRAVRLARLVLDARAATGTPIVVLLEDPTVTQGSGFEQSHLTNLRSLPEAALLDMMRDVVREQTVGGSAQ